MMVPWVVGDDGGDDIKAINICYVLLHVFYMPETRAERPSAEWVVASEIRKYAVRKGE